MEDKVRIVCLGGQDEFNKKMTLIEINDDIFVIECGAKLPDKTSPGVDFVIANISYLAEHKSQIKGYFLTHGFDATIGALPYIYKKIPAPVYCSDITQAVLEGFKTHNKIDVTFDYKLVNPTEEITINGHRIDFFQVCSSMSRSSGLSFHTSQGNVIIIDSFVIDNNADKDFLHDAKTLGKLSEETTLALLLESRYSTNLGYTNPKYKLIPLIQNAWKEAQGRIFVALGVPDLYNITQIILYAIKTKRKILPYDAESLEIFHRYGKLHDVYSSIPAGYLLSSEEINRISSKDAVILVIGWGERLFHKIALLASGENEDKRFALNPSDTFIVGITSTNETEISYGEAINELYRTDCKVVNFTKKEFSRMHASEEDIKTIIALLRPKYYIPVYGALRELYSNAKIGLNMGAGLNFNNIFVLDNGDVVEFNNQKAKLIRSAIMHGDINVDGKGIGDVSKTTIEERQRFSDDGVVIVAVTLREKDRTIVAGPDIQMRGFVYLKDSEILTRELNKALNLVLEQALNDRTCILMKEVIERNINDTFFRTIRRLSSKSPIIIPYVYIIK